jgi:hypothetical protein
MVSKLIGSAALIAALIGIAVQGALASTMPVRNSYRPFRPATHTSVVRMMPHLHDDWWATQPGWGRAGSPDREANPYMLVWRLPNHGRANPEAS